jgi:hypothetical protein
MVQLSDYQASLDNQVMFGGQTTIEDLDNLNKALSAEDITGRDTTNLTNASGAPLKVESLDKTLKVLTHSEQDVTIWKNIPQSPAYNTVEEYNQLASYGADRGGFNNEGETPVEEDSVYIRRAQLVKFLGVTKSVTHPMQLVNTHVGSIIDREVKNGTLWILRKIDRALYFGDESIIPQEFNGLLTQHQKNDAFLTTDDYMNSGLVVDLRGKILSEEAIEDAANTIVENFGRPTQLYAPPKVLSDFVKNFYGNKFIQPNTAALTDGVMGQKVKSFESQFGNIGLNYDIFFNKAPNKAFNAAQTSQSSPNAPTAIGAVPVATDALGKFAAADAGDYIYAVSAINRFGESAMTVINTTPATIVAGGAIDIQFTDTPSIYPASGYIVYRSQKNATTAATSTFAPLFQLSKQQMLSGYDGAAANTVRDRNRYLPNTNRSFLAQWDTDVVEFKQLAPLMKMDLAIVSPAYRFMVLLYGTPFLYNPKKFVQFINIGTELP